MARADVSYAPPHPLHVQRRPELKAHNIVIWRLVTAIFGMKYHASLQPCKRIGVLHTLAHPPPVILAHQHERSTHHPLLALLSPPYSFCTLHLLRHLSQLSYRRVLEQLLYRHH
jgi:hypothetical protein